MKVMGGTPLKLNLRTQLMYGVQFMNGTPYMEEEGEARLVYQSEGRNWYFNEETHEIEMR